MTTKLRPLSDTFVFREYDRNLNLNRKILSFMVEGKRITPEQLLEPLTDIEKRYAYTLKNEVVENFKDGTVVPMICETTTKLPNMVPGFAAKGRNSNDINFYVNLTNYSSVNRNGDITIETKTLYNMLQTGLIYKNCYFALDKFQKHMKFNKNASYVYATMFTRVLNKSFSLNTFPDKYDEIMYLSSKFFLIHLLHRPENDIVNNVAAANCKAISKMVLEDLDNIVAREKVSPYSSIDRLISFIADNIKGLGQLNIRGFMDAFITMYAAGSLMSLEFLPFFLHTISSIVIGSFIINQYSFEPIASHIDEVLADVAYIIKY